MSEIPKSPPTPLHRAVPLLLAVPALIVAYVLLEPSGRLRGHLLGEPFAAGHPASHWGGQLAGADDQRAEALQKLEQAGPEAIGVLARLLLTHADPEIRWTSAELLGKQQGSAHVAAPELLRAAADDTDPHVRLLAAVALPQVETPPDQALPILIKLLSGDQAAVVARAISVYKGAAEPALEPLVAILKDDQQSTEARWNAARALGKLGPAGLASLPVLIEFTKHPEETIREHSAEAIGDIGPTAVAGIPALIECLDDPAVRVRRDAVRSLGYMGTAAAETVPQILPLLQDPEEIVRSAALAALKAIDPTAVPATESTPQSTPPPAA